MPGPSSGKIYPFSSVQRIPPTDFGGLDLPTEHGRAVPLCLSEVDASGPLIRGEVFCFVFDARKAVTSSKSKGNRNGINITIPYTYQLVEDFFQQYDTQVLPVVTQTRVF